MGSHQHASTLLDHDGAGVPEKLVSAESAGMRSEKFFLERKRILYHVVVGVVCVGVRSQGCSFLCAAALCRRDLRPRCDHYQKG